MKIAVIYSSRYGSTAKAAEALARQLETKSFNLSRDKPDLTQYDGVILGSPIFAGNLAGKMKKFIETNKAALLQKHLGLFICCAHEGEEASKQIETAYPADLVSHAVTKAVLGGAVNLEKHNFLIRALLKKVGIKISFSRFSQESIAAFALSFLS